MSTTLRQTIAESAENYFRYASRGVARVSLEEAACRSEDLEMFFAVGDGREEQAKQVCRRCPVRWECLTYALETRQRHGVWGGLTPEERVLLVRKIRSDASQ
jgi:WhiB family redox-sensing transcriptional regulator